MSRCTKLDNLDDFNEAKEDHGYLESDNWYRVCADKLPGIFTHCNKIRITGDFNIIFDHIDLIGQEIPVYNGAVSVFL